MPAELASILKIEVPVMVQIASRQMTVREVSNLAPGAIIELPKLANEELEVMVSNRTIGAGMAVKVGENFGVRVTYVGDLKQRIRALAAATPEAAGAAPAEPAADGAEPAQTEKPGKVEATGL